MSAPRPNRGRRGLRLLLVAAATLVALLAGELAYRGYLAARGDPYRRADAEDRIRAMVSTMTGAMPDHAADPDPAKQDGKVLQPYIGLDLPMAVEESEAALARYQGLSTRPLIVLILGGSVAAQVGNVQHQNICNRLAADPRIAPRGALCFNQGRGAFKQPQQATLLAYLFALGWRPDVVVNIDGFNELAVAWDNVKRNAHPAYPSYWGWALLARRRTDFSAEMQAAGAVVALAEEGRVRGERALRSWRLSSALLGRSDLASVRLIQNRWFAAQNRYAELLSPKQGHDVSQGPVYAGSEEEKFARLVEIWVDGSRSLHGLCSTHGATYVHVLQPTLHDEGSKPLTEDEIRSGGGPEHWIDAIRRGYPLLRAASGRLKASGIHFHDLTMLFRDYREPVYYDGCHFKGRGLWMFGEAIADAILASLPETLPPAAVDLR